VERVTGIDGVWADECVGFGESVRKAGSQSGKQSFNLSERGIITVLCSVIVSRSANM
jgi:hypothetical protein